MSRPTLTNPKDQWHLEQFGYVVVPFLDRAGVQAVADEYERIGRAPDDPQVSLTWTFHSQSSEHKRQVADRIAPLVQDSVDQVLDRHTVYLTTFITKWTGENSGFGPHQDPTLVDERKFRGVVVWMPLGPTGRRDGVDNGMLHIVPGSHLFTDGLREQNVNASPLSDLDEELIASRGVGIPTRPGEAIIFDNRVIHYSRPNLSTEPRVVLSLGVRCDEGKCVLLRPTEDGSLELFEVDDDFYIDVLPAERHLFEPAGGPLASISATDPPLTAAQFDQLCADASVPPSSVPPTPPSGSMRPGVFCHFCGGSDGLSEDDRRGRPNAQLICATCEARMASERREHGGTPSEDDRSARRSGPVPVGDPRAGFRPKLVAVFAGWTSRVGRKFARVNR